MSPRARRLQFSTRTVLIATSGLAVCLAVTTYPARKRAETIATYDAQKSLVDSAISEFAADLESDGYRVENDSSGTGGSGEWRMCVAITANRDDKPPLICHVEVMGSVSHDDVDEPTWMDILPMTLSRRGTSLDERFISFLSDKLDAEGWEHTVDDRCKVK